MGSWLISSNRMNRIFSLASSSLWRPKDDCNWTPGPIGTAPEEFENGGSLWKRIKCFLSTLRRRNLTGQQSPAILDLCLRKTRSRKSHYYPDAIIFGNLGFQNVSPFTRKRKVGVVLISFQFVGRFRKAPFSWRTSVDGRPKRRKLRFQISPA